MRLLCYLTFLSEHYRNTLKQCSYRIATGTRTRERHKMDLSSSLLIFVACLAATTCNGRPSDPQPVKTYDVDLNSDPHDRWGKVLDDHRVYLPEIEQMVANYIPEELLPVVQQIAKDIENILPSPFAQEIIDAILLNILYDLTAYCTSIVAQDGNGTIWHARNLDYSNTDILRNLTVSVNFRRGNETVYTGTTYAGYVGLLTGQRPNAFTVTIDQRGVEEKHDGKWWENLLTAVLDRNSSFVSFLVRQLATTVIHATAYVIVGGVKKGEGVIITRDRVAALNRYYLDPLNNRWYVLETNYDHWLPAPPGDNQRRAVGEKEMDKLGATAVNATTLYTVLSTTPVLNNGTTYTTIMSAAQPAVFNTRVRWPPL
ncbi:hypothetical protein BaRGS_00027875 [Batillaria attramentaria]|uniref:Acid ceramidase N-terminal domain-containing protein n=1 Tax=Batillaria attramentaria TaxID=370345 RepID=A0ABD0K0L8_9CAEN